MAERSRDRDDRVVLCVQRRGLSFDDDQSANFFAASSFFVPFMMPTASRSQPRPSVGKIRSIGAPDALVVLARYSNAMPMGNSPAPA